MLPWSYLILISSAFDSVDHSTLLSILQTRFSVTEQSLDWFRSYLTQRTQVFTTNSGLIPVSYTHLTLPTIYSV